MYRPLSHFRVRKAEASNSSLKKLLLQPLSMLCPYSMGLLRFIYVKFRTDTSLKHTKLSLQSLIEYCETNEDSKITRMIILITSHILRD